MERIQEKRWLSILVAAAVVMCMIALLPQTKVHATSVTADEAIAWVKSQEGKKIDVDGAYGGQCVDLIKAYYLFLGVDDVRGNGSDYVSNSLPSGWTRTKGGVPQKGDILVFTGGPDGYGHVAIYEDTYSTWHQNWSGQYVEHITYKYTTVNSITPYWGCIHPNFASDPKYDYADVPAGTYYFKNKSTGTYMSVDSATAANGQNVSVAAKKETTAFQFKITGGLEHYFYSMLNTGYVVNPYSDTPTSGTNVTLYKKDNSGTQIWKFVKDSGGYAIHLKYNPSCVLTANGTNVQLAKYTGAANQIWTLEDATAAPEPEQATLSSIAINPDSVGTIYEDGSQMDTSGLIITATYSDGTTANVTSGYSLTRPSLATTGTKTLTVTYEGKTATLDITVQDLFEGDGTESDPYLIGTDEDLKNVANMVNNTAANPCYGTAYYQQTADIDLSLYDWTPIGTYYESADSTTLSGKAVFKGHYDGNYHKVTNVKVEYSGMNAGLFGRLNYGNDNAVIENLSVTGDITGKTGGTNEYAGGIAAVVGYGAVIRNCDFTGTVNGTDHVGGIAGKVHNGGVVESCYVNAEVSSETGNVGGISGSVLAAGAGHSTDVLIKNCYFTGKLSGTTVGGIAGVTEIGTANDTTITFTNNYYLNSAASGAVAGAAQSGCMGLISSQLKTIAPDLGSPFADNPYSTLNDGFPVFEWQLAIEGDVNTDGTVSVLDIVALQKHLLAVAALNSEQCENADMDENGIVNAFDLAILKKLLIQK